MKALRPFALARAGPRLLAGLVCALTGALAGTGPAWAQAPAPEYAVKAAYLYKLGAFVEWPPSAFAGPSSPVKLCVIGDDPFGPLLDQAVSGQKIDNRPIVIERLVAARRAAGCHIAYIGRSDPGAAAEALRQLQGAPVLTVTDASREVGAAGIVNFVLRDRHVRFQIDLQTASRNGLQISSKLLSLAVPSGGGV